MYFDTFPDLTGLDRVKGCEANIATVKSDVECRERQNSTAITQLSAALSRGRTQSTPNPSFAAPCSEAEKSMALTGEIVLPVSEAQPEGRTPRSRRDRDFRRRS